MKRSSLAWLVVLLAFIGWTQPAGAHVGSKDIFEQVNAGPYRLFVTVRPPTVIPGVATLEVRASGPSVRSITEAPMMLTGEASHHPPSPDPMKPSVADPAFFTGSLWLMSQGSWQVRLNVDGAAGPASASIPVPAVPLAVKGMDRGLGAILAALGLLLVVGIASIVAGAVREARLAPGLQPDLQRRRNAWIAGAVTAALAIVAVWAGARWWHVEAADYAGRLYRPLRLEPTLAKGALQLRLSEPDDSGNQRERRRSAVAGAPLARPASTADLLLDHGHLMHLYAIRWPQMDAAFHLHPSASSDDPSELTMALPSMPPGDYHLYADVVHRTGFPETLQATLTVPPNVSAKPLDSEDASAAPPPLSAGDLGTSYRLPDGCTMVWDRPATLPAGEAQLFRFTLLDPQGKPAGDMQPYLGMAGHAAFVKTDGTVFAHTHPEGSAAMPAMMLAEQSTSPDAMAGMKDVPLKPTVEFPYGFPSAGRYRIFIQMKHAGTVETGVFDAEVK